MASPERAAAKPWARWLAVGLALLVWQGAAVLVDNHLLLASPVQMLARLWELGQTAAFYRALGRSFGHIVLGFLSALLSAAGLAAFAARFAWAAVLLRPYITVMKAVPVASFIILALVWLENEWLSFFISFLMVFPVIYTNVLQGLQGADKKLLEMAALYRVPWHRRLRGILLPALRPFLTAACSVALGVCWKSGVAAEVIGVVHESVGGRLYDAKIYLEIADLFAWTVVIVAVSAAFEKLFLWALGRLFEKGEAL